MNTRTRMKSVTFSRPFVLDEIDRELPAGAYAIEVEEERLDGVTFVGYRRVGTRMTVPSRAGTGMETWLIRPDGLEAALERDQLGRDLPGRDGPGRDGPETDRALPGVA